MNDDVEELAEYFELSQDKASFVVGDNITPARMVRMVLTSWNEVGTYALKSHHFAMIKTLVDRVLADLKLASSRLSLGQRNHGILQEFRNLRMSTAVPQQQALENGEKAWAAIKPVSNDPAIIHNLVLSAKASATHTPVVIPPWDALSIRMKIETFSSKCEDLLTQAELFVKNDENKTAAARNTRRLEAPPANYQSQQPAPQHHINTNAQHLQQQQHQQYHQPQVQPSQYQPYQHAYNGHYFPAAPYPGQAPHAALPPPHMDHFPSVSDPIVAQWWQQQNAQAQVASSSAQVNGVPTQHTVPQVYPPVYNDATRPVASTSQTASVTHVNGASAHYVQSAHQQQQHLERQALQQRQQQEQQRRQEQERQRQEQERQRLEREKRERQEQELRERQAQELRERQAQELRERQAQELRERQAQELRERQEQELRERQETERREEEQRQMLQQLEQQMQERHLQLKQQHQIELAQLVSSQKQLAGPASQPQPQVHVATITSTSQQPQPANPQLESQQTISEQSTYSCALGPPVVQPPAVASGSTNGHVNQLPADANSRAQPPALQETEGSMSTPSVSQPPAAFPPSSDANADQRPGSANVPNFRNLTSQEQAALYQQKYLQRFRQVTAHMQKQARVQPPSVSSVSSAQPPNALPPAAGVRSTEASDHGPGAPLGNASITEQNGAAHPPTMKRKRDSASTPAIPSGMQPQALAGPSGPAHGFRGFVPPVYPWARPMQMPPPGHAGFNPNVKWVPVSQLAHASNFPLAPGPTTARQQQRPAPVTAQAARRSTLARDIFRALEGVAPPEPKSARPAKRKRQPSPPPRRSSSRGSATPEHADIELVTPAVAVSSARAFASSSRLPLDDRMPDPRLTSAFLDPLDTGGGATIEEVDGRISPVVRKKQPLFWSDSSPDETQMQASGLSEDDVDNLLGEGEGPTVSSPEGQNNLDASRTASARLFPSSSAIASRGQASTLLGSSSSAQQPSISAAVRKVRHGWSHPKPDRLIVEVPRLPASWRTRKQELDYGSYADFPVRLCMRRCEWTNCPAILDSEDRLRLHWDKVHGAGRSDDRDFSCLWDTCDMRSTSLEKLRHHVRCRHIRDCLRCAYEGCDFRGASNEADLASHIAAEHGTGTFRRFAVPQQVVPVQIIPELPQGAQPEWRLTTPVVRPAAMSRERRDQLGNWVLMRIYAKVDFELITTKPTHKKRKDLAPQMKPLIEGFELEMKEQFEWMRPASSDLPKRIPPGLRIGQSVGPNAAAGDV